MTCPAEPKNQAFSLVEVVLAIGVFAFAAVTVVGLLPSLLETSRDSWQDTRAAQIARQIVADLRPAPGEENGAVVLNAESAPDTVDLSAGSASRRIFYSEEGRPVPAGDDRAVFQADLALTALGDPRRELSQVSIDVRPVQGSPNRAFRFLTRIGPAVMGQP